MRPTVRSSVAMAKLKMTWKHCTSASPCTMKWSDVVMVRRARMMERWVGTAMDSAHRRITLTVRQTMLPSSKEPFALVSPCSQAWLTCIPPTSHALCLRCFMSVRAHVTAQSDLRSLQHQRAGCCNSLVATKRGVKESVVPN